MLKKSILAIGWFPICLLLLIHNLTLLHHTSAQQKTVDLFGEPERASVVNVHFLSDNGTGKILGDFITAGDGRIELLQAFMKGAPMAPYADVIVREADKRGIDYRLVPAIAMCESNLGRRIPSSDSFNAWGIAVYTGQQHGAKFSNWEQAIVWVNSFLYEKFISKHIIDIKDIGAIWAPPSVEKGHSWANCVESFMRQIQ